MHRQWVIKHDMNRVEGDPLYWSHDQGWVSRASADVFTDHEKSRVNLPLEGKWVAVEVRAVGSLGPDGPFPARLPDDVEIAEWHMRRKFNRGLIVGYILGIVTTLIIWAITSIARFG